MSDTIVLDEEKVRPFSLLRFLVVNTLNFAFLIAVFWVMSTLMASLLGVPNRFWEAQFNAKWWMYLVVVVDVKFGGTSLLEYLFHRYVLHMYVIPLPFFYALYKAHHLIHHLLTAIKKKRTKGGKEISFLVENEYPITKPEQHEASFFPWYALLAFALPMTVVFTFLQWLIPAFPWFFGGYFTLFFALTLYEGYHAIEHWSFERWAPKFDHPRWGWAWIKAYGFHLRHHAVVFCNMAISGFFLLPIWDWIFGTYVAIKSLYFTNDEWRREDFAPPKPRWPISWLDEVAKKIEQRNFARMARKARKKRDELAQLEQERIQEAQVGVELSQTPIEV